MRCKRRSREKKQLTSGLSRDEGVGGEKLRKTVKERHEGRFGVSFPSSFLVPLTTPRTSQAPTFHCRARLGPSFHSIGPFHRPPSKEERAKDSRFRGDQP